jgi:hypothetical protein
LRKYSWPLPEEPSRFARQIASTRGKFSGASGSSAANRSSPDLSLSTTYSAVGLPSAAASSAMSSGFLLNVGYDGIQPMRALLAITSAVLMPANLPLPVFAARTSAEKWS